MTDVVERIPTHEELLRKSLEIHVCPYEVEKLAIAQARLAVVPYHYVFDPASTALLLSRSLIDRRKTILIIDEAHNLRDFMRGIKSISLTRGQMEGAINESRGLLMEKTAAALEEIHDLITNNIARSLGWMLDRNRILEELRERKGDAWLSNLAYELVACSEVAWGAVAYGQTLPHHLLRVGEFLVKLSTSGNAVLAKWENAIVLIDPNPIEGLSSALADFHSSLLISATLSPSAVFARSLGLDPSRVATYTAVPEPSVNVRTVIDTGVTTRYKYRGPEMFSRIAGKVLAIIKGCKGGVGVFTPSYLVLDAVLSRLAVTPIARTILAEKREMTSEDATRLFDSFRSNSGSVLFGVQGGRFSEGEDFREGLMETVIVVGLSVPPPSPLLFVEYENLKRAGETESFLMLSRLPALRKAFQSAGRHIRNPGRRGLVFLLDARFDSPAVKELMPSWMRRDLRCGDFNPKGLELISSDFWGPEAGASPSSVQS